MKNLFPQFGVRGRINQRGIGERHPAGPQAVVVTAGAISSDERPKIDAGGLGLRAPGQTQQDGGGEKAKHGNKLHLPPGRHNLFAICRVQGVE